VTDCTEKTFNFPSFKRRKIDTQFKGGDITSDGGVLLLREIDRQLNLSAELSAVIPDPRNPLRITHTQESLLKQRIYGLALGYEDLNDHDKLRTDPAFQTAVEKDKVLASSATLCRLENRFARRTAWNIHRIFVEKFIQSYKEVPKELILDFDATDDLVHGEQEGGFFHGYYEAYCFLPLYVFCGKQLLVSYLRTSKQDGAKHAWAILSLLVKRLRQQWPDVNIIFRGDSGFCRHKMLNWCERKNIQYIVGLPKNKRLLKKSQTLITQAEQTYQVTQEKQRLFSDIYYAAESWDTQRRVIVKAEHTHQGDNTRFVVTNLAGDSQHLYDTVYCARGEMENRIKEQQLELFANRTSCHEWWANQFRLLLSSAAYILISAIRRIALAGTQLAQAQCNTIRLKIFKIGGVIIRNTRRIKFLLSSSYPYQELFMTIAARLCAG
jgi:Transposase DDE domain group 1